MLKISACLTAALLVSALAMPISAGAAPRVNSGGGGAPVRAAPAMRAAPHFSAPHFAPRSGGVPHFTARGPGVTHFTTRRVTGSHITTRRFVSPHVTTRRFTGSHVTTRRFVPPHVTTRRIGRPNLATTPQIRSLRHAGTGISTQTARQGRFSSRFAARANADPRWRSEHIAARRAWRHGHRAGFVAWYGPVFWPYAYSDIFDYAFWPYGYDDGFWDYAYDDFIDGLFWGEYGPPGDYVYAYAPPSGSRPTRATYAGVEELCTQPGTGITAWPFADIEHKVGLNNEQKQLLGDVRKAAADAAATFKASCPTENAFPLTPPGRLAAMTGRLQATLDAVKVVQPALDKFYNSLSDEQKERFNQLGPTQLANNPEASAALPQDNKSCTEAKPGLATLPIEKIGDVVKPTDAQQASFKELQDATNKAVSTLQAACPDETPLTPPGRLAAMEKRLQAMIDAANTVKPALDSFYSSLSNEQKARFDRIRETLAQDGRLTSQ